MKVLFLAAEATPFVKVGGLADISGELPPMLRSMGVDVRVVLPFYDMFHEEALHIEHCTDVKIHHIHGHESARLFFVEKDQDSVYLIDGRPVRNSGSVYEDTAFDAKKFTFAFIAAMEAMRVLDWQPDVLHAHDWHAAPAIAWLSQVRQDDPFWAPVASVLTVHNLPFMGAGGEGAMAYYGILPSTHPYLPYWARHLPLPMGLASADWINTVSPTYAQEIQTAPFGHGLEELLRTRSEKLSGILNGIDVQHWNPATDPSIPVNYSRDTLPSRRKAKLALQDHLGLRIGARFPLISMISRFDHQKGIDVALAAMENLIDEPLQFVMLGSGDKELENRARLFAEIHQEKVQVILRFDAELAREIYAGADMILIPSRYEPCGVTQMIAMHYGCIPIVSATGGLKDTVVDYNNEGLGTGFIFSPNEPQILAQTIRRAFSVYGDQRKWRGLQLRAMVRDFSWGRSAREYINLYQRVKGERKRGQ
jgi:starch synthase